MRLIRVNGLFYEAAGGSKWGSAIAPPPELLERIRRTEILKRLTSVDKATLESLSTQALEAMAKELPEPEGAS